jgi:hypothetical protein
VGSTELGIQLRALELSRLPFFLESGAALWVRFSPCSVTYGVILMLVHFLPS